ncbi:MAG: hypothetical protein WCO26_11425 [Deltaproteobacteria bacterium]
MNVEKITPKIAVKGGDGPSQGQKWGNRGEKTGFGKGKRGMAYEIDLASRLRRPLSKQKVNGCGMARKSEKRRENPTLPPIFALGFPPILEKILMPR